MIVVVTVACALAVFSMDALAIGERNRSNAGRHEAGAPVVVQVTGGDLDGGPGGAGRGRPHRSPGDAGAGGSRHPGRRAGRLPPDRVLPARGAHGRGVAGDRAARRASPSSSPGRGSSLDVRTGDGLRRRATSSAARSTCGSSLVVTSATGVRRAVSLGSLPSGGTRSTAVRRGRGLRERLPAGRACSSRRRRGDDPGRARARRPAGRRARGRLGSSASDWNTTAGRGHADPARGAERTGSVRFELDAGGFYPIEVSPGLGARRRAGPADGRPRRPRRRAAAP